MEFGLSGEMCGSWKCSRQSSPCLRLPGPKALLSVARLRQQIDLLEFIYRLASSLDTDRFRLLGDVGSAYRFGKLDHSCCSAAHEGLLCCTGNLNGAVNLFGCTSRSTRTKQDGQGYDTQPHASIIAFPGPPTPQQKTEKPRAHSTCTLPAYWFRLVNASHLRRIDIQLTISFL